MFPFPYHFSLAKTTVFKFENFVCYNDQKKFFLINEKKFLIERYLSPLIDGKNLCKNTLFVHYRTSKSFCISTLGD